MKERKLIWELYPSYILLIFVSLVLMLLYTSSSFKTFYISQTTDALKTRTTLMETQVIPFLITPNQGELSTKSLSKLLSKQGAEALTRFTLISPNGDVIADSDKNSKHMDNHASRPEIIESLEGNWGSSTRYSRTLQTEMLYISKPLFYNDSLVGVFRSSVPINKLAAPLALLTKKLLIGGCFISLFSALIGFIVSRKIRKPIADLTKGAEEFAKGNFEYTLPLPKIEEFKTVALALNNMASQLNDRMNTILKHAQEKDAILYNMVEGVITVNKEGQIKTINDSAKKYICSNNMNVQGLFIHEVIRNTTIQQIVQSALDSTDLIETDVELNTPQKLSLHIHGISLKDSENITTGALIVFHDVTRLRSLENMRKNFVANVSHELKTPITLIKGFLETLFRGAINNKDDREEFLKIINNHADRLDSIINDLLSLSRIEQEHDNDSIETNFEDIVPVIEKSILSCKSHASKKEIDIIFTPQDPIITKLNISLLEQAVINLIDNAIKYSASKNKVTISLEKTSTEISLTVSDMGRGIPEKHIAHLFERFYRVDKDRSRELGGTGLGLAIVKHIAQAHNGHVSVTSKSGEGSQFTIHLPLVTIEEKKYV
jgi:two-component system, OmpR family, phosphate regulon sensor histidine kinase PhoR